MEHKNFYLKLISILLILTAIFFYNRMAENRLQRNEIEEVQSQVKEMEKQIEFLSEQQKELLTAFDTLSEELKKRQEEVKEEQSELTTDEKENEKESEEYFYKDGTYMGEGQGFGGMIQVEIEIEKDELKTIKVVDASGEDTAYLNLAHGVIERVLEEQSTDVDTISGATFSSTGILIAIEQALGKAEQG